jgi:hypothetical protein
MLVYRIAMLAWALWVALALLRWLRWGWEAFTTEGLWRKLQRTPKPPPQGPMGPHGPRGPHDPMGPHEPPHGPFDPAGPTGSSFESRGPNDAPPSKRTAFNVPPAAGSDDEPSGTSMRNTASWPSGPVSSPTVVSPSMAPRTSSAMKAAASSAPPNNDWAMRQSDPPGPESRPLGPPSSSSGLRRPSVLGPLPGSEMANGISEDDMTVVVASADVKEAAITPTIHPPKPLAPLAEHFPPPEGEPIPHVSQSMEGRVATGPVTLPGFLSAPEVLPEVPPSSATKGYRPPS